MIVDNKGGMFIRDTLQRGNQSVTFINEERDVLKWNTLSQVEFTLGYKQTHKAVERHVDNEDGMKRPTPTSIRQTNCHRDSRLKVYKWERPAISWHNRRYSHVYFVPICTCRKKKKQLYFILVLIYTDNKVKSKEGKRRNGLRHEIFLFTSNINL